MTKRRRRVRPAAVRPDARVIAASEFKAVCLQLMDQVHETGVEYVVTKHKRPVARLVPYAAPGRSSVFGAMKGTVIAYDRPFDPIEADWDIDGGRAPEAGLGGDAAGGHARVGLDRRR